MSGELWPSFELYMHVVNDATLLTFQLDSQGAVWDASKNITTNSSVTHTSLVMFAGTDTSNTRGWDAIFSSGTQLPSGDTAPSYGLGLYKMYCDDIN